MERNVRICPKCGCDSFVSDSRISQKGVVIRRRTCQVCEFKWSTGEIPYKLAVKTFEFVDALEDKKEVKNA